MTSQPATNRPDTIELERLRASLAAPGRRTMTRAEALDWNSHWSDADNQVLVRHLARVGATRFSRTADDAYVRCVDAQDRTVMVIAPGYLTFPKPWVNEECAPDWPGITLSTFGLRPPAPRTSGTRTTGTRAPAARTPRTPAAKTPARVERVPKYCPRCFLELTTTGVCGNCD